MWLYFHYRNVNSECYIITCLPALLGDTYKESQEEKTDNASFHTSGNLNTDNMGNPPYGTGLAPKDFFLFPHSKKKMHDLTPE